VVVGGDIHAFFANDLHLDFDDPASPVVATEFVGTSITSYPAPYALFAQAVPDNPHVRFCESRRRGYVSVDLERARMEVRLRVVSDAHDPKADIATLKTFCGRERPSRRGRGVRLARPTDHHLGIPTRLPQRLAGRHGGGRPRR